MSNIDFKYPNFVNFDPKMCIFLAKLTILPKDSPAKPCSLAGRGLVLAFGQVFAAKPPLAPWQYVQNLLSTKKYPKMNQNYEKPPKNGHF